MQGAGPHFARRISIAWKATDYVAAENRQALPVHPNLLKEADYERRVGPEGFSGD